MKTVTAEDLEKLVAARPAYKWRTQEAREHGANCVAYVDARQVMSLLDEVVGAANWQDHYREVAGNVYCDLSIKIEGEWVTKSDCGAESNIEAEKGQASDAFKRAAVKWGIGRFLYELPIVRIKEVIKNKGGKYVPAHNGKQIWDLTEHIRKMGLDRSGEQQKQGKSTQQRKPAQGQKSGAELASHDQLETIQRLAGQANLAGADFAQWLRESYATSWSRLTSSTAEQVITGLNQLLGNSAA